jgi:SAM-dependent methyltransferase
MTAQERWLAALWPRIHSHLPQPPASVIELGCGRLGGFVPWLREDGYEALGVDPAAPEGKCYRQAEFEETDLPQAVDAVIACTSLHHVADPNEVLDRIATVLAPGGVVVVVEWDWENFDEATARWSFDRLDMSGSKGWLHRHREGWSASGEDWQEYLRTWAGQHGLHTASSLVNGLDQRFARLTCARGPYLFSELSETSEADERAAIEAGTIQALRVEYVGRLP